MPTTMNATELAAATADAAGFVSKRNAGTLLERVAALRAAGEPEERVLARLNMPAHTGPLTDDATPSRGDAGMTDLERRKRLEAARRTTVQELADAVAERITARIGDQEARLDAALRAGLERLAIRPPAEGRTTVEVMLDGKAVTSAVAAANASAATTHDDSVPWETRPAPDALPTRATQRETLNHLRGNATVQEVAGSLGITPATAHARLVTLHANGHVQRRLVNGRYVYRIHPELRDQVFPGEGATGAALVRETIAAQRGLGEGVA